MALPPLGAQLIIFGGHYKIEDDIDTILDGLAAAGYTAVEGGPANAAAYRDKLAARGMAYGGSHTGIAALEDPQPLIDYLHTMGAADLCNSGLRSWHNRSLDDYRDAIAALNKAGRRLRQEGIHLHYHNHDFEFLPVDGSRRGIDLLLDGLDPEAVDLCVDVAWVKLGGDDPAAFLRAHAERVGYLHLKDHDGTGWCPLGEGTVDLPAVRDAIADLPAARWAMVEQDNTKADPFTCMQTSRDYLRTQLGY